MVRAVRQRSRQEIEDVWAGIEISSISGMSAVPLIQNGKISAPSQGLWLSRQRP